MKALTAVLAGVVVFGAVAAAEIWPTVCLKIEITNVKPSGVMKVAFVNPTNKPLRIWHQQRASAAAAPGRA